MKNHARDLEYLAFLGDQTAADHASKKSVAKMDNKLSVRISEDICLCYSELPIAKGCRKGFPAKANEDLCVVFRKNSSKSALSFLMKQYPELEYLSEEKRFASLFLDCFVSHGHAYYFSVNNNGTEHKMIAIILKPLWDTAHKDLVWLINNAHYCEDSADNPDGVFMDDYGLC